MFWEKNTWIGDTMKRKLLRIAVVLENSNLNKRKQTGTLRAPKKADMPLR